MRDIYTFVGATGRQLKFQLRDETGNIIDASGYSTAHISGLLGAVEKIQQGVCDLTDAATGWVYYTPAAGEIDTEGTIKAQIKLTSGSSVDFTEEFNIIVQAAHDYAAV